MADPDKAKKKMMDTDNYLSLYYDLKKAEQDLALAVDESVSAKIKVPEAMLRRIEAVLPKK